MTYTLALLVGEGEGREGGEGEARAAIPVLHRDTEWQTEQRHTLREGEVRVVCLREPGGREKRERCGDGDGGGEGGGERGGEVKESVESRGRGRDRGEPYSTVHVFRQWSRDRAEGRRNEREVRRDSLTC